MSTTTQQQPAPDFGEPWQNELGDFEIYDRTSGDAVAYAEDAKKRDRVIVCVNACAGMADPAAEIQAMREAITQAHQALKIIHDVVNEQVADAVVIVPLGYAAAALAKLQPHLHP